MKRIVIPTAIFYLIALAPITRADPCDLLYEAAIKSLQTPHHVFNTTTQAGKVQRGEAIYAGGVEYLQRGGQWQRSRMAVAEMVEAAKENLKTHPDVCSAQGSRMVDALAVDVFAVHSKEGGTDQEVRVAKATGLLQGSTMKLPDGALIETRYDYANVQVPPGL